MEKQEITSRKTIQSIISGFASYGIITIFICTLILTIGNYILKDFHGSSARGLYITLPLMAIIILYFVIHLICKLSIYDVFKKYKTNPDNYKRISKYLNIFFIVCIILSIVLFLGLLYLNLQFQKESIHFAETQYAKIFSPEHVQALKSVMVSKYNQSKTNLITSTIILEIGFSISFLSLIPYKKKMISKYNEF